MKQIKKVLSLILVVCMTVAAVPTVFSASVGTVDVGDTTAVFGQTVTVPVTITPNSGVWGIKLFVYYPKALTLTNAQSNGIFGAFEHSAYNVIPSEMPYDGAFLTASGVSDSDYYSCCLVLENFDEDTYTETYGTDPLNVNAGGTVVTLTFVAPSVEGNYAVNLLSNEAINNSADDIELNYTGGVVTVRSCLHANGTEWRVTTPATCTNTGVESQCCKDCGKAIGETRTIPANGHTGGSWEVQTPASCLSQGEEVVKCTVCHEIIDRRPVSVTAHTPDTVITPATCTEAGRIYTYCMVCNTTISDETIPAKGHTPGEKQTTQAPTCTEEGAYIIKCSSCQATIEQGTLPALGHNFSSQFTIDVQPTATESGSKSRHCMNPGCSEVTEVTEIFGILLGDANSDGIVTIKDSLLMTKYLALFVKEDALNFRNSDIDNDGEISMKDKLYLRWYLCSRVPSLDELFGDR